MNPLSIAVAAVLLAAGGAFGWSVRTAAPTARAAPEVTRAALGLERLQPSAVCAQGGVDLLRDEALRDESPVAERLRDYLPRRSPIPGYEKVQSRALDPVTDAEYLLGAVEGQVSAFRPPGDGGFDVYAYRFLTRPAAAETLANSIVQRVCRSGAAVFAARGRPGLLVVEEGGPGGWTSAWRLTRADVVVVRYGGWGDPDADLANLAVVTGATAPPG